MEIVLVKLTHSSGKIEHLPIRAYLDEETSSFSHWLLGSPDVCFILFFFFCIASLFPLELTQSIKHQYYYKGNINFPFKEVI